MIATKMVVGALIGVLSLSQTINPGDSPTTRAHKVCYNNAVRGVEFCEYIFNGPYGASPHYESCRASIADAFFECMENAGPTQNDITHE